MESRLDSIKLNSRSNTCRPGPFSLEGNLVQLKSFNIERDINPLYCVSNGQPIKLGERSIGQYDSNELIWKHLPINLSPTTEDLRLFYEHRLNIPNYQLYCIFDKKTDTQIGSISYLRVDPTHLTTEIGLWISPIAQGSGVCVDACYLLLKHIFALGYRRVQWSALRVNQRSCNAALKLGFLLELEIKNFMIENERVLDACIFRIINDEWNQVQLKLEKLLLKYL